MAIALALIAILALFAVVTAHISFSIVFLLVVITLIGFMVGSMLRRTPILAIVYVVGAVLFLFLGYRYGINMGEYIRQSGHPDWVALALVISLIAGATFTSRSNE